MAKKPKKEKPVKEPGEKKKLPIKLIIIIVAVLLLLAVAAAAVYLFVLRDSDGEEEPPELSKTPAVYTVGLDEVVSLDSIMEEGAAMLTTVEAPTRAAEEEGVDERTFRYRKAEDPAKLAASYVEVLLGEEQGFVATDDQNQMLAETPDLERLSGSVILEKAAAVEEGAEEETAPRIFRVVVAWSEYALAIQVSHRDGTILPPPEPEAEDGGSDVTNVSEQLEFFKNLSPSVLGLYGASMSEYNLYPLDGWVRVNGYSCRQINVYLLDMPAETNSLQGMYFVSGDLQHLFTMDDNGNIVAVDLG